MHRQSLFALLFAVAAPAGGQSLDRESLPREIAAEVTALYEAPATLRADGPWELATDQQLQRDVVVLGGPVVVAGRITGRLVVVNGDLDFRENGAVNGDVLIVGGRLLDSSGSRVSGTVRTYSSPLRYERQGTRVVWADHDDSWWRRRDRWRERGWGDLRLVTARTYNRVEGLPIQFGPAFGREFAWGRVSLDAMGIIRSTNSFAWTSPNLGHTAKAEVRFGRDRGLRLGARHVDVVEAVEPWQMGDTEAGLAAFFLHRDFRDFYNRHGGTLSASLFRGRTVDLTGSWSDMRWGTRETTDPWTLFNDKQGWRPNPQMDDARLHLLTGTLRYDTRNDDRHPGTGWFLTGEYEYGTGTISRYAPTTAGVRLPTVDGATTYDRLFFDLRRYNRVSPGAQINVRLVAGGWLSGDDLPLQRRFSLGGPATMPGYDFRRLHLSDGVDRLLCSNRAATTGPLPMGAPGECERMMLAQVEFRGDLSIDPFGILDEDRDWRRRGWGRGAQWVIFADAGRGWLVGPADGGRSYPRNALPALSTFQTDIGLGLVLDDLGLYIARAVNGGNAPMNFFIRLRPRF